jgi:hypothetical protein
MGRILAAVSVAAIFAFGLTLQPVGARGKSMGAITGFTRPLAHTIGVGPGRHRFLAQGQGVSAPRPPDRARAEGAFSGPWIIGGFGGFDGGTEEIFQGGSDPEAGARVPRLAESGRAAGTCDTKAQWVPSLHGLTRVMVTRC